MRTLFLCALMISALALNACMTPRHGGETAATGKSAKRPPLTKQARRGLAFAQSHCAQCHGVASGAISRNPESPPFEAVVNAPGLTRETLTVFLRDSHNFPATMNFEIEPAQIDDLAAYMITLRREGYRPPFD